MPIDFNWSTPAKGSSWRWQASIVILHVVLPGALFLLDPQLIQETCLQPWYTSLYLLILIMTIAQYFYTACSSPGYLLDALKDMSRAQEAMMKNAKDVVLRILPMDEEHHARAQGKGFPYMPVATRSLRSSRSNSTCCQFHQWQPLRSKYCHDCGKCVLGFDHHCVWLGTCIGEGNHCRYWWYLFEETVLGSWTAVMYIESFTKSDSRGFHGSIMLHNGLVTLVLIILLIGLIFLIILLCFHSYLVATNQTTYEIIRKRRIPYLRNIPDRVHPFSQGLVRNLYSFCCSCNDYHVIHNLPPVEELEAKARPYTLRDILTCRCC